MDYYCEVCDKYVKPKSAYRHFISSFHKEYNKCKHIIITNENLDIKNVDSIFYSYITEHNKNWLFFLEMPFFIIFCWLSILSI